MGLQRYAKLFGLQNFVKDKCDMPDSIADIFRRKNQAGPGLFDQCGSLVPVEGAVVFVQLSVSVGRKIHGKSGKDIDVESAGASHE